MNGRGEGEVFGGHDAEEFRASWEGAGGMKGCHGGENSIRLHELETS